MLLLQSQEKLLRTKNNENLSFAELVKQHQDMIYRVCLQLLGNQHDAEDIAQDVFIKAYHSIGDFRGDSDISTWLYRIAVNLSLSHLRRRKRQRLLFLEFDNAKEESFRMLSLTNEDRPDQQYDRTELMKFLDQAINSLPQNQKTAFVLHKMEGLSNKEITDILGCSLSSVESRIHRAKKNIQKYLFKYYKKVEK